MPVTIDVHVHAIPSEIIKAIDDGQLVDVSVTPKGKGWSFTFPRMAASPPSHPAFTDFGLLTSMSKNRGIDYQFISPWTDLFGYTLTPEQGVRWSRFYNESLVSSCKEHPGMIPIGTIPLQSPEHAIHELIAAQQMGCKGIEIGTDLPGMEIDSPELEIVWSSAEARSMPLLIHPTFQAIPERLRRQGLKNSIGRAAETTIALTLLMYSGVLARHPGLRIVAAHGGGSFLWLLNRIERNVELGFAKVEGDIHASIERFYFDSVVLNPTSLEYIVSQVGANHILLGSDSPYQWEPYPVETVMRTHLSEKEKQAILGETAVRIFGITENT